MGSILKGKSSCKPTHPVLTPAAQATGSRTAMLVRLSQPGGLQ